MGQSRSDTVLAVMAGCVVVGIAVGVVSAMVWRQVGEPDYVAQGVWAGVAGFFFIPLLGITLLALGWTVGQLRNRLPSRKAGRTSA